MINKFKNLKIVQKLSKLSPKLKWLAFSKMQGSKINSEYIDMICSGVTSEQISDSERLEAMVRESIVKEFPNAEKIKSYDLLVDAVVHNIKKKQLQAMEEAEEIA